MQEINKDIKSLRRELKLTQADAALILNVTRVTYNKWERDTSAMPVGKYEELMAEFSRLRGIRGKCAGVPDVFVHDWDMENSRIYIMSNDNGVQARAIVECTRCGVAAIKEDLEKELKKERK